MKIPRIYLALFSIIVLLLFVSVGFNILQQRKLAGSSEINKLNNKSVQTEPVKDSDPSNIAHNDEDTGKNEIDELEYQLGAAEEEANRAIEQLKEELTKKDEYKKAMEKLDSSNMKKSIPFYAKQYADNYDPLFKKLNMSEEEFEEFKNLIEESQIAERAIYYNGYYSSSQGDFKSRSEASIYYNKEIRNLLDEEQYSTYQDFEYRRGEYINWNRFLKTLPSEISITEDQEDDLIETMYEGAKEVYAESRKDDLQQIQNDKQAMNKRSLNIMTQRFDKYLEASRDVLSPEQQELYKTYLQGRLDNVESAMKASEYLEEK